MPNEFSVPCSGACDKQTGSASQAFAARGERLYNAGLISFVFAQIRPGGLVGRALVKNLARKNLLDGK